MESIDLKAIELRNKIRAVAGTAFDIQQSNKLLISINSLLIQRAQLAFYIDTGSFKNELEAIEQFKYLNDRIIQNLSL